MQHVRELKTKWQIRFYTSGEGEPEEISYSFQKSLYSKKQIQKLRDELYVERDRGWDPRSGRLPWQDAPPAEERPPLTLRQAVDAYCRMKRLRGRRAQRGGWNEATFKKYRTTLRMFARESGSNRLASSLTREDLEAWIFRSGLSPAASATYRRMLTTFVRYLSSEGLAAPEMPEALKKRNTIKPYFTEEEFERTCQAHERRCWAKVQKKHAPKRGKNTGSARLWMTDAWRVMFYQGLRRGELLALRCGAVDLAGRRMRIGDEAFIPKGQDERIIPITAPALPTLEKACQGKSPHERLFPFDSPGRLTQALKEAAREAMPEKPGLNLKALRRSCGYYWAERGVSPWDIKDLLRHRSITTTEQYYVQQVSRGQTERFDHALGKAALPAFTATPAGPTRVAHEESFR